MKVHRFDQSEVKPESVAYKRFSLSLPLTFFSVRMAVIYIQIDSVAYDSKVHGFWSEFHKCCMISHFLLHSNDLNFPWLVSLAIEITSLFD